MGLKVHHRFLACFAATVMLGLAPLSLAVGQVLNRNDPENAPDVFVPASRDLQLQLNRARKALQEGSFVDAADLLGSLIAVPEAVRFSADAEDYFLDAAEAGGTYRSLKSEVLKLLGGMPAKGREAYEIRYGADAKSLVDAAVEAGDIEKLTEAARMYFHTKAGYEAMLLIARYHYIQGRPLAAALCAQRVVDAAAASTCEPEASLLVASAWWSAGYPDRAKASLVALRKKMPRAQVEVNGKKISLFATDDRALAWLQEILPEAAAASAGPQENWVMHRGDPARNAESKGGAPVRTPIWQALPVFDPEDEAILRDVERGFREQPAPAAMLSVLHPLAIGDDVIMRLPDRVIALDFETGKAKWEYPWDDTARSIGQSLDAHRNQTNEKDKRRRDLTRKIWEDAAQGQLASDGEQLYFLDGLDITSAPRTNLPNWAPRARGQFNTLSYSNSLVCLELQGEGRQKWVVGGASGEDEDKLAGAWFLGAPLAMQGQVYVLAEIMGEIRLVVLDADTGRLQWWQQLCQVEDFTPIQNDLERKLTGCSPSYADGVMVCPTSAGAIVAVDIATRSLIWGHRYQSSLQRRTSYYQGTAGKEIGKRWADCTVTIAEGKVLVCTPDNDELHCLDLLTGKRIWGPTPRNGSLYIACVRKGFVTLVNSESMTALRLADAASAWSSAIPLKDSRPSGRGFVEGDFYYLPTENSQILKINLIKGEIVERIPTAFPLGNLVCHGDAVIAQSTRHWLSLFHQLDPLRAQVAKRLAADPADAWALARQGEILSHDGKPREAMESLKASLAKAPTSRSTRAILARTMLGQLRENYAGNPELVKEAAKYVERPEDRAELLQLELNGLMKVGALSEAFDRLMQLAIDSEQPGVATSYELIQPPGDPARKVTRDRWQRGMLLAMWKKGTGELRDKMQKRFAQEAAKYGPEVGTERLTRFVSLFGGFPGTEGAHAQLIKIETAAANYLRAELLIEALHRLDSSTSQATAEVLAVELGLVSSQPDLVSQAWKALMARNEPLKLVDGRELDSWKKTIESKIVVSPAKTWPAGAVEAEALEERSLNYGPLGAFTPYRMRTNGSLDFAEISVARLGNEAILVRDRFGAEQFRLDIDRLDNRQQMYPDIRHFARVKGNFLLVAQGFQLLALDLHRSAVESDSVIQWNLDLIPPKSSPYQGAMYGQRNFLLPNRSPLETTPPRSEVVYSSVDRIMGQTSDLRNEGICFHRGLALVCAAPLSGKVHWERTDVPMGYDLHADESTLVVADRDQKLVRRFRLADGEELTPAQLGDGERVWGGVGSNVLTSQSLASGKTMVRLWSFAEETPRLAWQQEMPPKSVGCLVEGVEVALLDPSGELTIQSLDEAKPAVKQLLNVSDGMSALTVQRTSDAYFVYVHQPPPKNSGGPSATITAYLRATEPFHGSLYAIDRQSGTPLWPSPARIDMNAIIPESAPASPLLVFCKITKQAAAPGRILSSSGATRGSLVVVDKATGRNLFEKIDFGFQFPVPFCRVDVAPKTNEVTVIVPAQSFGGIKINYTDEPRPPEPPAQSGNFTLRP